MGITASQLIAEVKAVGASEAEAQLVGVGSASDVAAESTTTLKDSLVTTGVGFNGLTDSAAAYTASLTGVDAAYASLDETTGATDAALTETSAATDALTSAQQANAVATDESAVATGRATVAQKANAEATAKSAIVHKEAEASMLDMGHSAEVASGFLEKLKVGLEAAGLAELAIGAFSVKWAGDFQSSITKLYTTAGESQSNLKMVGDGILTMSSQVGTGALKLGDAMYWVESAGLHGAKALEAERVAAQAAKAENADLDKVSIALAASLNAYAGSGMTDVQVMNTLTAATGQGMMTFEQLSGSLASVLPAAAKFHISLNNVTAALADMTAQGDPADQAATHLKQVILALEAPSKIGASALKSVGLTSAEVAKEMKVSLPDALQMITDAVGKKFPEGSAAYNQAIKNIAGGSKQMMGFLELTGSHMGAFVENVKKISGAVKAGGTDLMGWSDIQQNFNFKLDSGKAAVEALFIRIGTMLLPTVTKLFDVITPLVSQFSNWVGTLSTFGEQVAKATAPVKQIQEYLAPLPDAFERGTGAIHTISNALTPLVDTFDHAKAVIGATTVVTKPLVDSFDHANAIIPKFTTFITKTKEATSPLVTLFLQWKPVLVETLTTVEKLAGDVETFATGIAGAAEKSGAFQSVLQLIHNILPDVDTFLTRAGSTIVKDLLPPLESLITNVGYVVRDFTDWLDKSGTAKSAIADLGTAVEITAESVGTLVGWLADIIGWFDQDAPQAYILAGAVTAVGLAFAGLKVANTVAGFQQMFAQFTDGESIISKLASTFKDGLSKSIDDIASKQFPNLKKAMDANKQSAEDLAVSEEKVGTVAKGDMATGVETGATESEASLASVETQANAAATAEERVATTAETKMATGVATGAGESEASLSGITVAAEEATVAEETVGTTAETKMAGGVEAGAASSKSAMGGLGGMIGGLVIGLAVMGNQLAYNATAGKDFVSQFKQGDWLGSLEHFIALGTPGGQLASTIDTFSQLTGQVKTFGQQMGLIPPAAQNMDKKVVAAMTDMQKQSIAQGAQLTTGLQNLFATLQSNADGTFSAMDDSAYSYLKDVEDYVSQAQEQAVAHQIGKGGGNIVSKNFYASGTDYAPGGPALVGERGAELVLGPTFGNLPQGSRVIPHAQTEALLGGLGGGGNNQPIHVHVHIADQEFSYLTDAIMGTAARQTRLRHGRRSY